MATKVENQYLSLDIVPTVCPISTIDIILQI